MATFAEQYKKKKSGTPSGGSTFAERFKSSDIGKTVRDDYERKLAERKVAEKQRVIDDSNAKAEKYYQESTGGVLNTINRFLDPIIGGTKAVGATAKDVLTPWNNTVTPSVTYQGVEYKTPGQKGVEGGQKIAQGQIKQGLGQVGEGLLDVAQFIPVGGAVVRGATKAVPIMQGLKNLGSFQGLKTAGVNLLKNKSVQQNAALMGGYGATGAMQENQGAGGIALETSKGVGIGAGAGLAFEGAGSLIGRAFTNLFEKIGTRPRVQIDETVARETVDEITDIQGKPPTPEEEDAILEAFANGATKEEIITEVGKVKVSDGFEVRPKLAEVVDQLETNGEKLSLEDTMTVKKGLDEGKSFEEIQTSLRTPELAVKSTPEPRKVESNTNTPDNGDDAFLKAVETRFKESKTNKFREYKRDESGKFSVDSDAYFKKGDAKVVKVKDIDFDEGFTKAKDDVSKGIESMTDLPVLVRQKPNGRYEIIDGNHRVVAALKDGESGIAVMTNEPLYRRMAEQKEGSAKYRTVPEDPLLQEAWKGKTVTIYRGTGPNSPLEGNYFTLDKNYAREFLGSGRPEELKKVVVPASDIYKPKTLPDTTSVEQMDRAIAEAKANGFKAVYALEGGTDKPSVFYIDKVSKDFYNQPLYNKAQGGKNRLADDFERVTGQKITPEQEAKIIALNKKLFGDEDVKITAQLLTPEGQKAFGVYKNKVIKILDGQADPTDTFYHEAVHKYLDLFTTLDEQKKIYLEARKLWKTDNLDELEEKIAENFIRYAKTSEGVTGTLKEMFNNVIDRIKVALGKESEIEALYKDILEGKAKKGDDSDYLLTAKEATKREKEILSDMKSKERALAKMEKATLDEEKFLARQSESTFIGDPEEQHNYQSFKDLLRRFKGEKQRQELLNGDASSIKRVLGDKLKSQELDNILYSTDQSKSEDEMLDYFRGIYEKDKEKITSDMLVKKAQKRLESDPDYAKLQDELASVKERKLALEKAEQKTLDEVNKELAQQKPEIIEPKKVEVEKEVKPKTSVIASRLNEALPEGFKIDESYDPKVIKEEIDKASQTIFKDKEAAIKKAFDPNTNPVERDAILIELSEIAKRDGDFDAVADLFQRRAELIRSGAQSLNMEKASILLNPQEKYMRDIVNSRLGSVKVNGKDLTEVEVSAIRKTVRRETSEITKKAFKIQDAQSLLNSITCT